MLKHTDYQSTLDQELFPGLREEKDKKRLRLYKCAFIIALIIVLALCYGPLWETSGQQVNNLAKQTSPQDAAMNNTRAQTTQTSWLSDLQTTHSDTLPSLKIIPKGTLIPVEIESTHFGGSGRATILARTKSYVFTNNTVVIPPGSEVRGIAQRIGDTWKIRWNKVSVLSVGGHQAEIQAMNEISGKVALYVRSVLVKAN